MARLTTSDSAGTVTKGTATGTIDESFAGAGFKTGDFILNLTSGAWFEDGTDHVGTGDLLIRHNGTPSDIAHLLSFKGAQEYRVSGNILTVHNALADFSALGAPSGGLSQSVSVDLEINLKTGIVQVVAGLELNLGLIGLNVSAPALGGNWAQLEQSGLILRPDISLPGWLAPLSNDWSTGADTVQPTLIYNSDGWKLGLDFRVTLEGPYTITFLDMFAATASNIQVDYETGDVDTWADDVLTMQGEFALNLANVGEIVLDVGHGVDLGDLADGNSHYIQVRDTDGDGDADFIVNARAEISSTFTLFGYGFQSGYIEFDNSGGSVKISGGAVLKIGSLSLSADLDFVQSARISPSNWTGSSSGWLAPAGASMWGMAFSLTAARLARSGLAAEGPISNSQGGVIGHWAE